MKFKVTVLEEIERDVMVEIDAETGEEAMGVLSEMDDSDALRLIDGGDQVDYRVTERNCMIEEA